MGYRLGESYLQRQLSRTSSPSPFSGYPIVFVFAAFCVAVGTWGVLQGKEISAMVTGSLGMAVCWVGWKRERAGRRGEKKEDMAVGKERRE